MTDLVTIDDGITITKGNIHIQLSNGVSFVCEDHDIKSLTDLLEVTAKKAFEKGYAEGARDAVFMRDRV